jgi:hypothetical protein
MLVNGDPKPAVESIKKLLKIYPLAQAANPPETKFTNMSGVPHSTIHANDFHFFEEIHEVLEMEPNDALDPETLGLFASIGLEKGKPFAPDARMKRILIEAAAVGNATARALAFRSRDEASYIYPGSSWWIPASSVSNSCSSPACSIWTAAPHFTIGPQESRLQCLLRWSAKVRSTPRPLRTVRGRRSTAARTTRFGCHPTFR